eukprot:CAMPEP_0196667700 /NCGR_PEP_ID=MMETSP1086-20130531/65225_1 /TAXON_ID=77921 /ORGANISM="Cyanoptyche  gloeocystis , Strain SAG4.97" /LENGTH=382 /DNA_ID=CAMNT_0042005053 /DNA_START=37 /DNA_END=1185 /DNA_ORIENTATION=-
MTEAKTELPTNAQQLQKFLFGDGLELKTAESVISQIKKRGTDDIQRLSSSVLSDDHFAQNLRDHFLHDESAKRDQKDAVFCMWLYEWYRAGPAIAQQLVVRFFPDLIFSYLSRLARERVPPPALEAVLLGIFNLDATLNPNPVTFSPPSISEPSIYHGVPSDGRNAPTGKKSEPIIAEAPKKGIRDITSQTRPMVLGYLLLKFANYLLLLPPTARVRFCQVAAELARTGYGPLQSGPKSPSLEGNDDSESEVHNDTAPSDPGVNAALRMVLSVPRDLAAIANADPNSAAAAAAAPTHTHPSLLRQHSNHRRNRSSPRKHSALRIPLPPEVMQALIAGLGFCLDDPQSGAEAMVAVNALRDRAQYELLPEVTLAADALLAAFD